MYYIHKGSVFKKNNKGAYVNVSILAKNKVIVTKELESITVNENPKCIIDDVEDKTPYTLEEIQTKFNLSEENPIPITTQIEMMTEDAPTEKRTRAKK